MTELGISLGIVGIIFTIIGWCISLYIYYRWKKQIKAKRSDDNLVKFNPTAESVRILEGVNPLEQLQQELLRSRLEYGLNRSVEDIGSSELEYRLDRGVEDIGPCEFEDQIVLEQRANYDDIEDVDFYSIDGSVVMEPEITYLD